MDEHFLYPSTLFVSKEPYLIKTILGSCVSICLFDPINKVGGMNHYMLPFWNGMGLASPKYGNIAIDKLIQRMLDEGCKKTNLQAKVFGGGKVIDTKIADFQIGERNIQIAHDMMKDHNIAILAESTGGNNGRKIILDTFTGSVKQQFVQRTISAD